MEEVTVYDFQDKVTEALWFPSLSLGSLTLGEANCHAMRTLAALWRGPCVEGSCHVSYLGSRASRPSRGFR